MAKMFRFRLEQLLDLRRSKQDAAERDFADARQAVADCNQVLHELMNREDEAKKDLLALQLRAVDVGMLRLAADSLAAMDRLLKREYEKLQGLVLVEMEKRDLLTEARRGVRVLERFRDRKAQLHRRDLDREELRFLDEVGRRTA